MTRFLLVGLAGAFGTWCRYLVGLGAARVLGTTFPYGTLVVNVVGCFIMAALMEVAVVVPSMSPTTRLVLTTGFVGGFTTYSAFNYETTALLRERGMVVAFANLAVTLVACFGAGLLGALVARRFTGG